GPKSGRRRPRGGPVWPRAGSAPRRPAPCPPARYHIGSGRTGGGLGRRGREAPVDLTPHSRRPRATTYVLAQQLGPTVRSHRPGWPLAEDEEVQMFRVENADFIADKLASELLPNQEYREVAKNAEEAVERRIAADGEQDGRIEFDVDWALLESVGC